MRVRLQAKQELIIVVVVVLVVNVIFKKQGLLKNVQDIMQTIM